MKAATTTAAAKIQDMLARDRRATVERIYGLAENYYSAKQAGDEDAIKACAEALDEAIGKLAGLVDPREWEAVLRAEFGWDLATLQIIRSDSM